MELTGVEWFEGAPRDKSANRIVEGEYYSISDGSGGVPKYALTIRKNTPPEKPVEYSASRYSRTRARTAKSAVNVA